MMKINFLIQLCLLLSWEQKSVYILNNKISPFPPPPAIMIHFISPGSIIQTLNIHTGTGIKNLETDEEG